MDEGPEEDMSKFDGQVWYVEALEVLSPLRFHLFMLIQDIENKQRWSKAAGLPFGIASLKAAKAALADAEFFFTGTRPTIGESCDP